MDPAVLPRPVSIRTGSGTYTLHGESGADGLSGPPERTAIVRRLLAPGTGLRLPDDTDGRIRLLTDDTLAAEAYRLRVTPEAVDITTSGTRGVHWAVQTLRQLLPAETYGPWPGAEGGAIASGKDLLDDDDAGTPVAFGTWDIPAVEIEDAPRFGWRGVMLDAVRHFLPYADLLAMVDLLAMHRYNTLHLHLTDDQGWRFESRRFPLLTERGATRAETPAGPAHAAGDGTPHGGFYTQAQLRGLVGYAADRGITVVPEIEFPGHLSALLSAYPQYGHDPEATHEPLSDWGISTKLLTLTDESLQFAFDVWDEVLDVFPSRYVHIGGDEVPRDEWRASDQARQLAAERGLPDVDHLQRWFTEQLRDRLVSLGRRPVGWDEINDEGPLEGAVTMAWRSHDAGVTAATAGLDVVMADYRSTYLDYYQSDDPDEPLAIDGPPLPIEKVYAYDPDEGVPDGERQRVLGTQCQLWAEYIPNHRRLEYGAFPRLCAHAEVAWSEQSTRDWDDFAGRLTAQLARLDALGVEYRPLDGPKPWQRGGTGRYRRPT